MDAKDRSEQQDHPSGAPDCRVAWLEVTAADNGMIVKARPIDGEGEPRGAVTLVRRSQDHYYRIETMLLDALEAIGFRALEH